MRKIIALFVLVMFLGPMWTDAREIDVPVKITSFSDGGLKTWPEWVYVEMADDDSQLVAGSKTWWVPVAYDTTALGVGQAFYNKGLDTVFTVHTNGYRVKIYYQITYGSGNSDWINDDYILPYRDGYGGASVYFRARDTSGTDVLVGNTKFTFRDMTGSLINSGLYSSSAGYLAYNVDSAETLIVIARKSGYYFPQDTVVITSIASGATYTIDGYDTDSTVLCRVWAYVADLGANPDENVRVVAQLRSGSRVFNTCDSTWLSRYARESGYTDSDGYVEFYLAKSTCIGDLKYEFYLEVGNERRKLGVYEVPDQGDWRIGS